MNPSFQSKANTTEYLSASQGPRHPGISFDAVTNWLIPCSSVTEIVE